MAFVLLISSFAGCSGDKVKKSDIIGQWYASDGEMEMDVRKDGSYDDGGYGTGTWKYLDDDETVEFTDFYGYTKTTKIIKDEYGYSIFNGRYYRDAYPEIESESHENTQNIPQGSNNQIPETNQIMVDAFTGIKYEVTGISPKCEVSVNNSGCSADAQQRVTYEFDKDYYANGETATVTATIPVKSLKDGNTEYVLMKQQSTFIISNQPEYVKTIGKNELEAVKKELDDYVIAKKSEAINNWGLFGIHATGNSYSTYKSVDSGKLEQIYLTSVKQNKISKDLTIYNSLNFIYSFSGTMHGGSINGTESCRVYVNVIAYNVIKYPDGTVKWGEKDPDSYEFCHKATLDGVSNLVTTTVTVNSSDYNISKVEL